MQYTLTAMQIAKFEAKDYQGLLAVPPKQYYDRFKPLFSKLQKTDFMKKTEFWSLSANIIAQVDFDVE